MHDEELRTGGIRHHGAGHGQHAGRVLQIVGEAILAEFPFDTVAGASRAGALGASALDHETADDAVEDQPVIKSFFDQADEIVHGIRRDIGIKLGFHHIAVFHGNRNDRVCHRFTLLSQTLSPL